MTSAAPALLAAIAIAGVLHIQADYAGAYRRACFFKPLTVILIIAVAVLVTPAVSEPYRWLIVVALAFSLVGDVFLMLRSDRFVAGLVSFLGAHLVYAAAFAQGVELPGHWLAWVGAAALLGIANIAILPALGRLRAAGTIYALAIAVMAAFAALRWGQGVAPRAGFAAVGALFFVVSDASLAVDRFVRPFRAGQLLTLSTYYTGQTLIALSVGWPRIGG